MVAERIKGIGHRTPILTSKTLDQMAGRKLFFKCENFQKIGAFKFRGGWNAVSMLSDEEAEKGVYTVVEIMPKLLLILQKEEYLHIL